MYGAYEYSFFLAKELLICNMSPPLTTRWWVLPFPEGGIPEGGIPVVPALRAMLLGSLELLLLLLL